MREAYEILWSNANDTSAWAINVGDEKKRDRHNKGQNREQHAHPPMRAVADKQAAADGKNYHQTPSSNWKAVPPRRLRVSLPVQDIIHARNDKSDRRGGPRRGGSLDGRPHLDLELCRLVVDVFKLARITDRIEHQPLIKIFC